MEKIEVAKAFELTSPNPVTLVCADRPDGNANLAAVSWWTYVSFNPVMVCYAMGKKSYSGELVRANKRVALAMPAAEIAQAAFLCGTKSGKDTDKAKEFGIKLANVGDCPVKVPADSRMVFDCSLVEAKEVGDHYLYICDVNAIYADESKTQVFAWEGYSSLRPL